MTAHPVTLHCGADASAAIKAAADDIITAGNTALAARGRFNLALSGGNTPKPLYRLLASANYATQLDWHAVHIYFSDERCVAPQHADSNFRLASETLITHRPIPALQVHRIEGELEPRVAAERYERVLGELPSEGGAWPVLDWVLLGIGSDGHIASLFPNSTLLAEHRRSVMAGHVERLKSWRVSMTLPLLRAARRVAVLALGSDKANILHAVIERQDPALPATQLVALRAVEWYVDADAAKQLHTGLCSGSTDKS